MFSRSTPDELFLLNKVKLKTDVMLVEFKEMGCIEFTVEDWFVVNGVDMFEVPEISNFVLLESSVPGTVTDILLCVIHQFCKKKVNYVTNARDRSGWTF